MSQQFISESCSWYHREDNENDFFNLQRLSGIGLNRMGSMQQCQSTPSLHYLLLWYRTVGSKQASFYTGICYSQNCSSTDISLIIRSVNQYIQLPFTDIKVIQPSTQTNFWNTYTVLVAVILTAFVVASLVGTVVGVRGSRMGRGKEQGGAGVRDGTRDRDREEESGTGVIGMFDLASNFRFITNQSKNYERMRIVAGLRAFAFLGMAFYSLAFMLMQAPSLPQPPSISKHISSLYYSFDLWLLISGFYLAIQLQKQWSKSSIPKSLAYTTLRHLFRLLITCTVSSLLTASIMHSKQMGSFWAVTFSQDQQICGNGGNFGTCNFWMLIWVIEGQMCVIMTFGFFLWARANRGSRVFYVVGCLGFGGLSLLFAGLFGGKIKGVLTPPQGNIRACPIVAGVCYMIGFNLGLVYFWFRTHRNKSKLLLIRLNTYKSIRILMSLIALTILSLIYLYFTILEPGESKAHQVILQVFRMVSPLCFGLLILPELLGFENLWGALFKDRFMNMASKLSFSSFSCYYLVCLAVVNSLHEDIYVNLNKMIGIWMATIALALAFGFFLVIFVEVPVYRVLHRYLGRSSHKAYIEFY